jgi:hypothetical protein
MLFAVRPDIPKEFHKYRWDTQKVEEGEIEGDIRD